MVWFWPYRIVGCTWTYVSLEMQAERHSPGLHGAQAIVLPMFRKLLLKRESGHGVWSKLKSRPQCDLQGLPTSDLYR